MAGQKQALATHGINCKNAFRTSTLYGLIGFMFLMGVAACYVQAVTKNVTKQYKISDSWGTNVNAVSSAFNGIGRIIWGAVNDKIGFRLSMGISSVLLAVFMFLVGPSLEWASASESTTEWIFLLFWCIFNLLVCVIFVLMPAATSHYFGAKYTTDIYGFIFAGYGVSAVLLTLTVQPLNALGESQGYWLCFTIIGACALAALATPFLLKEPTWHVGDSYEDLEEAATDDKHYDTTERVSLLAPPSPRRSLLSPRGTRQRSSSMFSDRSTLGQNIRGQRN